jgi:hypothetical protein
MSDRSGQESEQLQESDLAHFIGSEVIYRHPLLNIQYTEGVRYVAQKAGAYWLIDLIASWQSHALVKLDPMLQQIQFWKLTVRDDHSAVLICERDSDDVVIIHNILFTDFPLTQFRVYYQGGILLLPSEY